MTEEIKMEKEELVEGLHINKVTAPRTLERQLLSRMKARKVKALSQKVVKEEVRKNVSCHVNSLASKA
jgi:3-methyladenine DNA glycosylase/8-oxoguanine DNA glycosylase